MTAVRYSCELPTLTRRELWAFSDGYLYIGSQMMICGRDGGLYTLG
ncbi:hypothetical protein PL8927_550063 [Planktothrix serta PCC 8927]|uniref:Uncharacterized protein n=1 Tax=Planktothrix serta PCC 8927 TaxID=671068 RepID=A0A7Z9BNE5_9CYAN|nr:hypothetical protein [Planktothrix serta]VXD16677.1 hypothetical protein PL8927_550063 [Planktothrix serta PCC 8927]